MCLFGCSVASFLSGQNGASLESVKPSATRAEIEAVLGSPVFSRPNVRGIRYAYYQYLGDAKSDWDGASGMMFLDIISAGGAEAFWFFQDHMSRRDRRPKKLLAVAYDESDRAVGVFPDVTEFTVLPEDGRSTPVAQQEQKQTP